MDKPFIRAVMKSVMEEGHVESCMTRTDLVKKTAEITLQMFEENMLPDILYKERKKIRKVLHG